MTNDKSNDFPAEYQFGPAGDPTGYKDPMAQRRGSFQPPGPPPSRVDSKFFLQPDFQIYSELEVRKIIIFKAGMFTLPWILCPRQIFNKWEAVTIKIVAWAETGELRPQQDQILTGPFQCQLDQTMEETGVNRLLPQGNDLSKYILDRNLYYKKNPE